MSTSSLGLPQEEQDVEETVGALEKAIAAIETQLSTFFDVPADEVQSKLAQFEQAKLNIVKVYAINTLFYSKYFADVPMLLCSRTRSVFLKTQGINPNEHPVKKELVCRTFCCLCKCAHANHAQERVKHYIKKIKDITDKGTFLSTSSSRYFCC